MGQGKIRGGAGWRGHEAWVGVWVVLVCLRVLAGAGSLEAAPAYPVKVGPTGRYLVDQNGVPFLMTGESPQAMIGDLSEGEAAIFFANRQAHGFNTVWINLLCNSYTGCNADGSTRDGIPPFTTPGDLTTPNEAYFARADRILQLAAQYGFLVILDPAETGGWLGVMRNNGVDKCRVYGQYVGQRYASFDNIVWMHGNDYQDYGPTNDQYTTAVALGIRDVDHRHIHTVELNYYTSSSLDDAAWAPLIELNASYTYSPTYQQVLEDYNRANFLPVFMVEASYEFEENSPGVTAPGIPRVLRRQAYWSNLSGATGQLYGNKYTWQFISGWQDQLDTPGAVQMGYVTALFAPRRWYQLIPDQSHAVVTAGTGTFGADDYVTAARTPDGQLVMAYVPSARTVTIDLSMLTGPVTTRWYDPAGGTFATISGSPFANAGSRDFTTPGNNADGPGNDDWVLVLEVLTQADPNHADLIETGVSVSPSAGSPGGSLRVADIVRNQGSVQAGASKTRYYLASTPVRGADARLMTGVRAVPNLVPNAVSAGVITVTIPLNIPLGTYYLLVCADDTGLITETDKSNNCQAAATQVLVTRPDLVPTAVSNPPGAVARGGSFQVTDTVTNQGVVAAKGSSTRYYLSGTQQKVNGDVLLSGSRGVPGLAAGAAWPGGPITVGVPATTPLGLYYLLVCADDIGLITETDESNNCQAAATQVLVTRPDLVPTAVSNPPGAVAPGGSFQVTDTVTNQAPVAAKGSSTRYYLSGTQQKVNGDVLLSGSRGVPGLAAGTAWTGGPITVGVPATTPLGLYYLLVCADDIGLITETDESNNCQAAATQVLVTRPDLAPTAVSNPPGTVAPGGSFQVTDTVTNQGVVAAKGSSTRYYLSGTQQKVNGDVLLSGSRGVPGLAAGAAWPGGPITVRVPATTPLGLYYLLVCANDMSLVPETDKSNNCQAAATQVQVTIGP